LKKIISLLFIGLPLLARADYWTQKSSYFYSVSGATGFAIGNTGYFGTGIFNGNPINVFRAYNPAANTWAVKTSFAGILRFRATGISIDSLGYIGMGIGVNNDLQDWWQYSPSTNAWTQKADFGGGAIRDAAGFSIGSYGYVATGGVNYSNQLWRFDPANNSWMQMTNFGGAGRQLAIAFAADGKGYVGTGYNGNTLSDFWAYDPLTNSWSQKAALPGLSRYAASGFSIGNRGYIGMGFHSSYALQDFWEYYMATNTWNQKADYSGGDIQFAAHFSIGNKGYVGTGMDGGNNSTPSFWQYTPDTVTGISDNEFTIRDFSISPNPANEVITINFPAQLKTPVDIVITDINGKKIFETQASSIANQSKISVTDFSKGIYFVTFDNGKEKAVKKFIKI